MLADHLGVGVARLEDRRCQPRHRDPRQLDARGHDVPAFRGDRGRLGLDRRHGGAPLQRSEVLLDQLLRRRHVDVADDRQARVVRCVVLTEEPSHVIQLHGLDVLVRSDDVAVVGMAFREQRLHERFFGESVRLVLDALAALVADDVLLVRERGLIDLLEQIAHAIRLEPQRQLELVGRDRLEVVRAVVVRRAVHAGRAGRFEQWKVRIRRDVLRALEHHVLEQVGEAGAPRLLVGRPDVIPEVHRHHRQPAILAQDHIQAIRQRVLLEGEPRNISDARRLVLRQEGCQADSRQRGGREEPGRNACMHGDHS